MHRFSTEPVFRQPPQQRQARGFGPEVSHFDYVALFAPLRTLRGPPELPPPQLPPPLQQLYLWSLPRALPLGVAAAAVFAPRGSDMEEFDSEDFSTSEEDEDYVPSGERFHLRRGAACPAPRLT